MPKGKYKVSLEVKQQILKRIKEEGVSVTQAAEEHGLSTQTIYGWIAKGVTAPPSVIELSRLKRENQTLHEIIGRLTVKLSLAEKKELG
ncbi:MAG: helix-turn-helix domain-containing protein [Candidatus Doudnabacteria bacterium]|nr:helix-turn-helix domain-containing protein [Candidatus Doudnabacteria bacterium]